MNLNKLFLAGRLTRDPEIKNTPSGLAIARLSIATNRRTKKGEEWVDEGTFVDCTAFGKTAEAIHRYLGKGRPIYIEGRLRLEQWQDKQSGQNRRKLSVIVESFQFVGPKDQGGQRQQSSHSDGGFGDAWDESGGEIPF
jgi:single-strand DNA-binding protein